MRENFTEKTKHILAGRVNYKCSFPGCANPTIGPSGISHDSVSNLGEAAHIYAASTRGPRANPALSQNELSSVKNGIWMCRHHARLIDVDPEAFPAATLNLWKHTAEINALNAIKNNNKADTALTTLVSLSNDLVFEGFWIKVTDNNEWTFSIIRFIYGNIKRLRELSTESITDGDANYYICVESEGEGRLIKDSINWDLDTNTGFYTVTVTVENRAERIFLHELGTDIKLDEELDLAIENGDFARVSGLGLAKQIIETVISARQDLALNDISELGSSGLKIPDQNHFPASFVHKYFQDHKHDSTLLSRLIKIDLARLINIPFKHRSETAQIPLNFINRIMEVKIPSVEIIDNKVPFMINLQWKDGNYWFGSITLHF